MKKKILILLALIMALTVVFVACQDDPNPSEETTVADQPTEEPTQDIEDPTTPDSEPETPDVTDEPPVDETTKEPEVTEEPTKKPDDTNKDPEPPTQEPETDDPMEPVNVFEADDIQTVTGGDPNNMTQDCLTLEDGFVHIVPLGPDPYYYPFAGVDGARYVAIRYRTDATGADMQLYLSSTGTGPQDDSTMIRQPVIADGEWHVIVFDTQSLIDAGLYNGEYVSYFRFDPLEAGYILDENGEPYKKDDGQWARYTLPEGCSIDVAYIGFFHSEAAVAKYDFEQYPPFAQPDGAGMKNASFDTFYVNNQMYFPDGGASDKLNEINNTLSFGAASELQSIMLRGWIGFDQAIDSFGYYVDNYEFVFDASFTREAEAGVINAGGEFASRFEIKVPLDYFEGNDHFVGFVVKLADGTVVQLRAEITIDLPELPDDITDSFVSDVNSNEIGTTFDASDLANFFITELPLPGSGVEANGEGKLYHMTSINDMYADVNGRNYIKANVLQSNANAWMFTRGYRVVNSDEVIEKYDPAGGIYKINNYYETDSAGSMGGAGIYARIDGGKLYINVKYYNPETITRVGNKGYVIEAEGSELTLADNGSTVFVMVDGVTYATIALSGSVTYGDINEVQPKNSFAEKAVITLKNGTTETIENTLIADTCEYQVGVVARAGDFKFDMIAVGGYSTIEVPELEIVEPDDPAPIDPNAPAHNITADMIHANATSGGGATVNNQIASSEIITEDGYTFVRLKSNGGDPYVAVVGIGENLNVPQYMAISYRNNSSANGQMFIGSGGGWSGQGDSFTLDWTDTNVWSYMIVDLTNCGVTSITDGVINYARLDFFAGETGEDTYFDVEYVAFFDSVEAAQKYYNKLRGIEDDEPAVEHDYVAEGLVSLYDGSMNNRNGHDTSATTWQDLVGSNHINVTVDDKNYFTDNGLVVNSVKNYFPAGIVDTINGNAYTVEINMADLKLIGKDFATLVNSEADRFALFYRTSNGVLEFKFAGCPGNQRNIIQNALPMLSDVVITVTYEVGGNSIIYINGEVASTMPALGTMEAPDLFFGHSDVSKQFEALFRGFRFYDRALTAEEVKHNADVDMKVDEPEIPVDPENPYDPDATYQNKEIALGLGGKGSPFSADKKFGQRINIGDDLLKSIMVQDMATYDDGNVNTYSVKVWQWNNDYATTVASEPLFVYNGENHVNCTSLTVGVPVSLGIHGDIYYEVEYLTGEKQFTGWVANDGAAEGVETYLSGNLASGAYLAYLTVAQKVEGELMDTHNFQSNASSIDTSNGNVTIGSTDLANAFIVHLGQGDVGNAYLAPNGLYTMSGFNALYTTANGAYAFSFQNFQTTGHTGFTGFFVRGIMKVGENTYFGSDGNDGSANSFGCGGIYFCTVNGNLRVNVKTYVDNAVVPVIYEVPVDSSDFTIVDNGNVISVIAGDKLVLTIVLNGTADYGIANVGSEVSAASAVLTLADGSVYEIENVIAAANMLDGNLGFATRASGGMTFEAVSLMPANTVTVPEFPHVHNHNAVVTAPTCTEAGYTTYTCDCGDTYVANEVEALGHTFENGTCGVCGEADPDYVAPALTPEEIVNAAYGLAEGATLDGTYTLTGVIISIDEAFSSQYNNITVTIVIGDMNDKPIQCYRLKGEGADALKKGDTITVTGTLKNYYGKIEFDAGCSLDSVVPGPDLEPEDPSIPGMNNVTINFGDYTFRTEEGSDYQIFTNGDFVFTQAQGSSNNWNTSYIGPIRLYVGHDVTIAYPGMTKIVIDGNSGKPQTGWVDSITDSNATVTIDGTTVTIEFATPVDSFTVTFVSQVRVNAITVYAPSAEEPEAPAGGEISATTTDTYTWIDMVQFTATVSGTYTFNLPAGLGAWDAVLCDTDWSSMPFVDFYENENGASFRVDIAAGNTYSFYVGATVKDEWVITWTVEEKEVAGGEDPDQPDVPEIPSVDISGTYYHADGYLVIDATAGTMVHYYGTSYVFNYTFTVTDGVVALSNDYGPIDEGMAMYLGQLILGADGKPATFWYNGTEYDLSTEAPEPIVPDVPVGDKVLSVGMNTVTVTDEILAEGGVEYTFVAEAEGTYTFASDFFVRLTDANGMMYNNGATLPVGTYTVNLSTMLIFSAGDYRVNVEFTPAEPELPEIPEDAIQLPYVLTVEGKHDVYLTFVPTEDCTLKITCPAGNYVSSLPDWEENAEEGYYIAHFTAGEVYSINPWGDNSGTYIIDYYVEG